MYRRWEEKTRLNVTIPVKLFDCLERDSIAYGVSKSAIVQNVLVNYYRLINSGELPPVSSGKPRSGDTP